MRVALVAVMALALSGCVTSSVSKLSPEAQTKLIETLAARCGGKFNVTVGGNTGQLGGTADARVTVEARCPVPRGMVVPPESEDPLPTP